MEKKGLFITLEGGEGSGKSTQIRRLESALTEKGYQTVITREPGGTDEAEKIRHLLVQRDGGSWTPMAESLLLFAARVMHVETLIKPALAEGKIVISDRFTDSTRAYQSFGHGIERGIIENLNTLSLGDFKPDMTFILDVDVGLGLARSQKRLAQENSGEDRYEKIGGGFHERLRQGYLTIAAEEPERCHVIDASAPLDNITTELQGLIFGALEHHAV